MSVRGRRSGFTLVELLAVVSLTALLVGLLLPALGGARRAGWGAACLSNLRQMGVAAAVYAHEHGGHLMPALYTDFAGDPARRVGWDFVEVYGDGGVTREPGAMWGRASAFGVMQCPEALGSSNWSAGGGEDPATGYNYNTSYLGGPTSGPDPSHPRGDGPRWDSMGRVIAASARTAEIAEPSWTAVFGDGGYAGGSNKFMRGPRQGTRDSDIGRSGHGAGAQAFRHSRRTLVSLADGSARAFAEAHRETYPEAAAFLEAGLGFLSEGNGLYDLSFGRE